MSRAVQAACAAGLVVLVILAAVLAAETSDRVTDVGVITRDPTAIAGVPWWTGAVSRLTSLFWAAAAAVNFVAAQAAPPAQRRSLLLLAVLCVLLGMDDTFLVHDAILRTRGVPEALPFAVYAVIGLVLAVLWSRTSWRRTTTAAFIAGATALAVSVGADIVHTLPFALEDGAKLLGTVAWCLCGWWAHADSLADRRADQWGTGVRAGDRTTGTRIGGRPGER